MTDELFWDALNGLKRIDLNAAHSAGQCIVEWRETGNGQYLIMCLDHYSKLGVEPPESVSECVQSYFFDIVSGGNSNPSSRKMDRRNKKALIARCMMNFHRCVPEFTISAASLKMAGIFQQTWPNEARYPASGIERDYRKHWPDGPPVGIGQCNCDWWLERWQETDAVTGWWLEGSRR